MRKNINRILSAILALTCALSVSFIPGNYSFTNQNITVSAAAADCTVSFGKVSSDYASLKTLADYKGKYDGALVGEGTYKLDNSYASKKVVEVPLTITNNSAIFVGGIYFKSDFEFVGCLYNSEDGKKISTVNSVSVAKPKSKKIIINNNDDVKASDKITLLFVLPDYVENGKEYNISFDTEKTAFLSRANGDLTTSVENGSVKFSGASQPDKLLKGDVNLDGKVNAEDATLILKYFNYQTMLLIGMEGQNPIEVTLKRTNEGEDISELLKISLANAKVNNDDLINSDDGTLVLKFYNQKTLNDVLGTEYTTDSIWASLLNK